MCTLLHWVYSQACTSWKPWHVPSGSVRVATTSAHVQVVWIWFQLNLAGGSKDPFKAGRATWKAALSLPTLASIRWNVITQRSFVIVCGYRHATLASTIILWEFTFCVEVRCKEWWLHLYRMRHFKALHQCTFFFQGGKNLLMHVMACTVVFPWWMGNILAHDSMCMLWPHPHMQALWGILAPHHN